MIKLCEHWRMEGYCSHPWCEEARSRSRNVPTTGYRVDQTTYGEGTGNCLAACVATIFGLTLDEVPKLNGSEWQALLLEWVEARGYGIVFIAKGPTPLAEHCLSIVSGKSPRGEFLHAVVYHGSKLYHDPHHSRAGIEGAPVDTMYFVRALPPSWERSIGRG